MNSKEPGWFTWLFLIGDVFIARPFEAIRDSIEYFTRRKDTTTHELKQKALKTITDIKKHPLAKSDPLHPVNLTNSIILGLQNCFPTLEGNVLEGIGHAIEGLLINEDLLKMPVLPPSADIVQEAKYRDELRATIQKYDDFLETQNILIDLISEAFINYIKALPPTVHTSNKQYSLSIPLTDLIESPGELIVNILHPFYDHHARIRHLFKDLRTQVDRNIAEAKDVLPNQAKGDINQLTATYLKRTPLSKLFDVQIPIVIERETWGSHAIIAAPSGHGKSQTLGAIISSFLAEDDPPGLILIEPHNDLINKLEHLDLFNPVNGRLKDRLVVLDPADTPALNFLDVGDEVNAAVIENFKYLMSSLSSELTKKQETAAAYILLLTRKIPNATIETLREIMEESTKTLDNSKFAPFIAQLEPHAQDFFRRQFYSSNMADTRQQIAQRLYTVLANDTFRKMFAAPTNSFSAYDILQQKKILLVNANRDTLQKDGAAIFGRWVLSQIMTAAYTRPHNERHLCLVVLDEAHTYFDSSTETILSELRKFGVGLCSATQYLERIDSGVKAALYGNTAIKMTGPVSHNDASSLAREMYCDVDFIRSCRSVDRSHTEFALYTKRLPKAVKIRVPFGVVENMPQMSPADHRRMRQKNRERYGTHEGPARVAEPSHVVNHIPPEGDKSIVAPITKASTPTLSDAIDSTKPVKK